MRYPFGNGKTENQELGFLLSILSRIFETPVYAHLRNSRIKFLTCIIRHVKYL